MPELIIFDCDGTLVDSERLYNTVISDMLIEQGLSEYTPDICLERFTGLTLSAIRAQIEAVHNLDLSEKITSETYVGRAQAQMDLGLSAIAGAAELLALCVKNGQKICVASNGERSSVIKSMKLTDLYEFFGGHEDFIFTKIQVKNAKPAPDLFLFAAEKMGAAPKNCLVLEDSVAGVIAGARANMHVVGFTGSHHAPDEHALALENAGAKKVVHDLLDRDVYSYMAESVYKAE